MTSVINRDIFSWTCKFENKIILFLCFILSLGICFQPITIEKSTRSISFMRAVQFSYQNQKISDEYDVCIIGAGIGGLSAAGVLSSTFGMRVGVFESHYHAGGCAHSFPIKSKSSTTFLFDSGPTIILGCSQKPYNPLRQVFDLIGASQDIEWISYKSWGMCTEAGAWNFKLGANEFEQGPLKRFGGEKANREFVSLRQACEPLVAGAAEIPTKALRGNFKLLPMLPYLSALQKVIPYADVLNGSFQPLMDAHVTDPWLRSWLDALAFSLSGLPASQTGAAAMAYTLFDLHRENACLDYPRGGIGKISDVLMDVIKRTGSDVHLSQRVTNILVDDTTRARALQLSTGQVVKAKRGIICNANIWALPALLKSEQTKLNEKQHRFFFPGAAGKVPTKSFMHLHLGLDSTGLDLPRMQPHYTVMDQGLHTADPCADRNMVAVSNPSLLDSTLVDRPDRMIVHAYGAGNEDYSRWEKHQGKRYSTEYKAAKADASSFLYRSVARALDIPEQEVRERSEVALTGSPLTHERFLSRHRGTYGSAWGEMLEGPLTPIEGLYLCGDSVFPGIGVPAVALSGASAANSIISLPRHMWEIVKPAHSS